VSSAAIGDPTRAGALRDPMTAADRRAEAVRRLQVIRERCDRDGAVDVLSSRANVAWATAGGQHHSVTASADGVGSLVVTPTDAVLVAPSIETDRLRDEELAGLDIAVLATPWWEEGALERTVAGVVGPRLTLDDAALEPDLRPARSVLSEPDVARLAELGRLAENAVTGALAAIAPGASEDALAAAMVGRVVGARSPVVLVASDERIERYRHPLPTAKPIVSRVMLVLVAEAWGLHVALTRFREFAEPPPHIATRVRAVADVQRAMTEATVPGATLGDVFGAAKRAYAEAGRPEEWRDHHQGGTIAYHGREVVAVPDDPTVVVPGNAFAWNPSIAGAKAEDTFVLLSDGTRRFVTGEASSAG
jgi:antitoxin VapB